MELPLVLSQYFSAVNAQDIAATAECFAPEAVVHDEGEDLQGIDAVTGWIESTTEKYRVTHQVQKFEERNGESIVTSLVSGTFDGSPIELDFHFTINQGKITRLRVE